jgi:hypothetical protein
METVDYLSCLSALPHKNLPVSVSESSSFPFLSHALSLALKRVHIPLAIRKAR